MNALEYYKLEDMIDKWSSETNKNLEDAKNIVSPIKQAALEGAILARQKCEKELLDFMNDRFQIDKNDMKRGEWKWN